MSIVPPRDLPPAPPPPRPRARSTRLPAPDAPPPPRAPEPASEDDTPAEPVWRWLLLGAGAAWPITFALPAMFGWVLAAIPHEIGHATIGCLLGRPSAPAISLGGHAWTGIGERRTWLVVAIALAFATAAWVQRRRWLPCASLALAALGLPLLAFANAAEIAISAGGHLGELAFATYCYALCITGGRTGTPQERTACALAGSLLQGNSLKLMFGLLGSAAARDVYGSNGSLGLKNDLLVLAEDHFGCRLQAVAFAFAALSLLPLPLGIAIGQWRRRRDEADDGTAP